MSMLAKQYIDSALALVRMGKPSTVIEGTHENGMTFIGRADLLVVREAWNRGADFEDDADGFGAGYGTNGDWSAIRDSSDEAIAAMTQKAVRFLQP